MHAEPPNALVRALAPLPAGYHALFERLVDMVTQDHRIRTLELAGSVGRGAADAGSDLDVVLGVEDASYDVFCRGWRDWLATVTPTVIAREIAGLPGSFFSVTPGCERFDVVVERAGDRGRSTPAGRIVVMDRDGITLSETPAAAPRVGPDVEVLAAIVEEFFRQQAIFPAAVVARQDWLLGVVGTLATQRMLYDLLVETNQPLPVIGVKQWSARLTAEQRTLLEALPVPNPRRDEVVTAMLAVRDAMLTAGRAAAEGCGMVWPDALDTAVAAYYRRELDPSPSPSVAADASAAERSTSPTTRIASPGE